MNSDASYLRSKDILPVFIVTLAWSSIFGFLFLQKHSLNTTKRGSKIQTNKQTKNIGGSFFDVMKKKKADDLCNMLPSQVETVKKIAFFQDANKQSWETETGNLLNCLKCFSLQLRGRVKCPILCSFVKNSCSPSQINVPYFLPQGSVILSFLLHWIVFTIKLVGEPENLDQGHSKSQRGRQGKLMFSKSYDWRGSTAISCMCFRTNH